MRQEQNGRWVYIPASEEIPVTFQIGLVGEDGVLLASDRANNRLGSQPRTIFSSDKFTITGNVAYCCAGDDFTQMVADHVFRLPRPAELSTKDFLYRSFSASLSKAESIWKGGGSVLMACDKGSSVELFRINLYCKDSCPMVLQVDDRDFQGDAINPAVFFLERYLPSKGYVKLPLDKLKLAASHTMLMASQLNPAGIHGLDIVLCRPGKPFERLGPSEIEELGLASKKQDSQIAAWLGTANC